MFILFPYTLSSIFSTHFYSSACITVKTDMKYPVTPVLLQHTKRALPESLEKRLFTDGAVDGTWTHTNLRSLPPQSSASAVPPRPHMKLMVLRDGIEPPTRGFSVPCSTDWATWAKMATSIGFEPTIFAVTGRHVNRYTTRPFYTLRATESPRTSEIISYLLDPWQ